MKEHGTDPLEGGRAPSPIDPNARYVDTAPYAPEAEIETGGARPDLDMPTGKLIRRRFLRHRLAVVSALFLAFLYLCIPFVEIIAPYGPNQRDAGHLKASDFVKVEVEDADAHDLFGVAKA